MNGENSQGGRGASELLIQKTLEASKQIGEQDHDPLEDIVRREDVSALLEQEMRNWPRPEREVFEQYYAEGRDPEEIEMVTDYPLSVVRNSLASVQEKLQKLLLPA